MEYKKFLIFICLIMMMFTVAGVNAIDVNDTAVASDETAKISVSDDANVMTDTPKSMKELNNTINNAQSDTIYLTDDYYYQDKDLENGITISKSLTIDGQNHKLDGAGQMRIFRVTNNATVTFKNIIFTNGWTANGGYGGAIWNNGAKNITAINCTFENNHANDGGAVTNITSINSTFKNNNAVNYGGAMYKSTAVNCSFVNNNVGIDGGAMYAGSAVNCSFVSNTAKFGGAMYAGSAVNCSFVNNTASSRGGAIDKGFADNCSFVNSNVYETEISFYIKNNNVLPGETVLFNGLPECNLSVRVERDHRILKYSTCTDKGWKVEEDLENGYIYTVYFMFKRDDPNKNEGNFKTELYLGPMPPAGYKVIQDLNTLINSAQEDTIILNDDYYCVNNKLESGIIINKPLTIDGQGHKIDANGSMRIFQVTNNANVTFKNIIFLNGWTGEYGYGGAIWNNRAESVTAINCTFENNTAHNGGAIANVNAVNSTFKNNYATEFGGAMFEGSAVNSSFVNNTAYQGGAMYKGSAVNSSFVNNTAEKEGGAMYEGSAVNSSFVNNTAENEGGAMYKGSAVNSSFVNNTAEKEGGAMYEGSAVNSSFVNNTAYQGGAMYQGSVVNSSFVNNTAYQGGAIYYGFADDCSFVNNTATNGGAMYGGSADNCSFVNNNVDKTEISFYINGNNVVFPGETVLFYGLPECNLTVTATKDGNSITFNCTDKGWKIENLENGRYTVKFSIKRYNDNYGEFETVLYLGLYSLNLEVHVDDILAGENATVEITTNTTFNGEITVTVNGENYTVNVNAGQGSYNISGLSAGNYTVIAKFNGDDIFSPAENTTTFEVKPKVGPKTDLDLTVSVNNITEGETAVVKVTTNNTFTGNVTIYINDKNYTVNVKNGQGNYNITELTAGKYTITAKYNGDDIFNPAENTTTFEVKPKVEPKTNLDLTVSVNNITEGETAIVKVTTNNTFTGNVTIYINDKNYTVSVKNGQGSYNITELTAGKYTITAKYNGDDIFNPAENTTTFEVKPKSEPPIIDIIVPQGVDTPEFTIKLPSDAKGTLNVTINGKTYTADLVNGSATIKVPGLADGNYTVTISYSGDEKYPAVVKNTNVTIKNPVYKITNNKNIKMLYTAKTPYKVLITKDGKAVGAGEVVTIKFNGKTYNVKTDKNGYATLKLPNVKPKKATYTITATYKGYTVQNKVKVNSIIKAKNKKVKKSKKVTKVKVSLKKVNGKYLKAKKLKIKFRGKTYKVKTNKKGVAIWKVKKSMLKKLKVGKKYKYKVTYGKNTVTKKLTIKR